VELADATLNTITYDGEGKRREYEDSAGLRKFVWDGENILLQTDSGGTTSRDYTYNPQGYGELVSQSGLFHHYDALGSTMQLTDETQGAVVSYLYRAFGEQTVMSGSSVNRFTWVGRLGYYRQPDTGDYWVRARVYRPTIGRWMSRDPWQRERDRYDYTGDSPLVFVDPDGRAKRRFMTIWGLGHAVQEHYGLGEDLLAHCVWMCMATATHVYGRGIGRYVAYAGGWVKEYVADKYGAGHSSDDDMTANKIGIGVGRGLCRDQKKDPQKPCEKRCRKRLMRRFGRLGD
jgi:RHS repeat-associated protein